MELYKKSAAELSALLRSKEVTACEILDDDARAHRRGRAEG